MIIFDGKQFAAEKEAFLLNSVEKLVQNYQITPKIVSIVFTEDAGGVVYAREKQLVAQRLGIQYVIEEARIGSSLEDLQALVQRFAQDSTFTGIIIQKPWRNTWESNQVSIDAATSAKNFQAWWHSLTNLIPETKDIDGLHPSILRLIKTNMWKQEKRVLPATCKAVLSILKYASVSLNQDFSADPAVIIGRSDLLGTPLYHELPNLGWKNVQLFGQNELQEAMLQGNRLLDFKTIITSTGQKELINGAMLSPHSILIDAGFPSGDMAFDSVSPQADFLTPVPNGVGPVTVISLLENVVELCYNRIL